MSRTLKSLINDDNFVEIMERNLRTLIDASPDFRYRAIDDKDPVRSSCSYNEPYNSTLGPACTGCIFGQAFQMAGVPRYNAGLEHVGDIDDLIEYHSAGYDAPPSWRNMQMLQDEGEAWGVLLKYLN